MTTLLSHISSTPISINALQKASGLGATALALALVGLAGQVALQDDGVVLAVIEQTATKASGRKASGPRGPISRTLPRLDAARSALMSLVTAGVTDAKAVLDAVGEGARYTDVLLVARKEVAAGALVEGRKGRKVVWSLPGGVEVVVDTDETATVASVSESAALWNFDLGAMDNMQVDDVSDDDFNADVQT